jgi:hypothetical protein
MLTIGLMTVLGCRMNDGSSTTTEEVRYAGPYTVKVYDEDTGEEIRGAVVEWHFYFASDRFDALKRHHLGVETTGADGVAEIPAVEMRRDDEFSQLDIVITKAGYMEARGTAKPGGFLSSSTIVFRLKPIKPMAPLR